MIPGSFLYTGSVISGMYDLELLVCEEGVVSLGDSKLTDYFKIIEGLPSDESDFYEFDCPYLKELWLPSTVAGIDTTFGSELTDIYIYSDNADIAPYVFMDCASSLTIHAHAGSTAQALAVSQGIAFDEIPDKEAMPSSDRILAMWNRDE